MSFEEIAALIEKMTNKIHHLKIKVYMHPTL